MPKKILIIEDEQTLIKALSDSFKDGSYKVEAAIDGEQGWEKVQSFKPDLILLDLVLPKMDGFTLLGKIKADESLSKIPILVLTNLSDITDKVLGMGADQCLIKSDHTMNEIQKVIEEKLQ